MQLTKLVGTTNPADMFTKHLGKANLDKHIELSGVQLRAGRADGSLQIGSIQRDYLSYVRGLVQGALLKPAIRFHETLPSIVGECPLRPRGVHKSNSDFLLLAGAAGSPSWGFPFSH